MGEFADFPVSILLVFPLVNWYTGNATTARRIKNIIQRTGRFIVHLFGYRDLPSTQEGLDQFIEEKQIQLIVLIHAAKGSRILDSDIPNRVRCILVLGGTDVNVDAQKSPADMQRIVERLGRAYHIVAFSQSMIAPIPGLDSLPNVSIIPQGIDFDPSKIDPLYGFQLMHQLRERRGISEHSPICLLVAGIRPVKDVLYLAPAFHQLYHSAEDKARAPVLVIVGPTLDEEYFERVKEIVDQSPVLFMETPMEQSELFPLIMNSAAVLNSSVSEGQSSSMLEAIALRVQVYARDIPGNRALVEGVKDTTPSKLALYSNPEHFIEQLELPPPPTEPPVPVPFSTTERDAWVDLINSSVIVS